jgi:hypothetical protein
MDHLSLASLFNNAASTRTKVEITMDMDTRFLGTRKSGINASCRSRANFLSSTCYDNMQRAITLEYRQSWLSKVVDMPPPYHYRSDTDYKLD